VSYHELTITRAELDNIRGRGRVAATTDMGMPVLLTRDDDMPADRLNADGRGAVWLPVNQHTLNELTARGYTGVAPNYADMVFGVYAGR